MYIEVLIKNLNNLCYLLGNDKVSRQWCPAKGTADKIKISYREKGNRIEQILTYSEAIDTVRAETNKLQNISVKYEQIFD